MTNIDTIITYFLHFSLESFLYHLKHINWIFTISNVQAWRKREGSHKKKEEDENEHTVITLPLD